MGLFKSKEEKQREIEERERIFAEESALEEKIKNLVRFPGSLSEYISLMEGDYEIMDVGRSHKYIFVDSYKRNRWEYGLVKYLIKEGCTGLIRYAPVERHGIPVRKK